MVPRVLALTSDTMGLFYAHLKYNCSMATQDKNDCYCRHPITFANREVADEWWRMISTPPSPFVGTIERTSSQFYVQSADVTQFFWKAELPDAQRFLSNMFFGYIGGKYGNEVTPLRQTELTDHISGRWYFIRSKADPFSHWYLRVRGDCLVCGDAHCDAVHVSSEHRTKFCIRVRDPVDDAQDFVMIARDEISIVAPRDYTIHIDDAEGGLKAATGFQGETDLLFGDLKNRFITRGEKQVNGEIWEYAESVERGSGEAWKLVD